MFVNRLASFVAIFLGLYLVRERGFTAAEAGRVVALFGAGVLVAGPLGGALADADRPARHHAPLASCSARSRSGRSGSPRDPTALAAARLPRGRDGRALPPGDERGGRRRGPAGGPAPRVRPRLLGGEPRAGRSASPSRASSRSAASSRSSSPTPRPPSVRGHRAPRVPETRPRGARTTRRSRGCSASSATDRSSPSSLLHLAALVVFTQFQLAAPLDMGAHGVGPGHLLVPDGAERRSGWSCSSRSLGPSSAASTARTSSPSRRSSFGLGFGVNAFGGRPPGVRPRGRPLDRRRGGRVPGGLGARVEPRAAGAARPLPGRVLDERGASPSRSRRSSAASCSSASGAGRSGSPAWRSAPRSRSDTSSPRDRAAGASPPSASLRRKRTPPRERRPRRPDSARPAVRLSHAQPARIARRVG